MKKATVALVLAACVTSSAFAGSMEDGAAGLDALKNGSYTEAARLFTQVLADRYLSKDNKELAYLSRGQAYAGLKKKTLAAADFRRALSLKPDDADARAALAELSQNVAPKPPEPPSPWGAMATLAGSWWITAATAPDEYDGYQWTTPGKVLAFTGMDRSGNVIKGQFELDPATGQISGTRLYKGKTTTYVVTPASDGFILESEHKGQKVRETMALEKPGQFQDSSQAFKDGAWTTLKNVTVSRSRPETVQALGWGQTAGAGSGEDNPVSAFFKSLGGAILDGAKQGLSNGVQNRVQSAVAGTPSQQQ